MTMGALSGTPPGVLPCGTWPPAAGFRSSSEGLAGAGVDSSRSAFCGCTGGSSSSREIFFGVGRWCALVLLGFAFRGFGRFLFYLRGFFRSRSRFLLLGGRAGFRPRRGAWRGRAGGAGLRARRRGGGRLGADVLPGLEEELAFLLLGHLAWRGGPGRPGQKTTSRKPLRCSALPRTVTDEPGQSRMPVR